MVRDEVKQIFKMVASVYPNFIPADKESAAEKLNTWTDLLADQSFVKVQTRVKNHLKTEKFPPTISEIIDHTPKEEENFLTKLDEWRRNAASPEVAEKALEEIREMLNG